MSRASSGTVAEAVATCVAVWWCRTRGSTGRPELGLVLALGGTVGNKPAGLVGDVPELGNVGSEVGGAIAGTVGVTTTTSVADPENAREPFAEALAVSLTRSPRGTLGPTFTAPSSSSTWAVGRFPILQTVPSGTGQISKLGASTDLTAATLARTLVP